MTLNVNVILGPSIIDGDIYRFVSTKKENGIVEIWDSEQECWIEVCHFERDITPDDIAKGDVLNDEELQSLTDVRKDRYSLQLYNAKKHVESAGFQALACFSEANVIEPDYKAATYHLNCEHFLILFRGDQLLHKKVFEYILKVLEEDGSEDKFSKFYNVQRGGDQNEKIDKVIKGPLLVKDKKKIIRVVEELPHKSKRLDVFENRSFRPVKKEDSVSWYDLRDAEKISFTEFYDIVRPPIGLVHQGPS